MEVEFQSKSLERFDYFWDKFVGKVEVDSAIREWIMKVGFETIKKNEELWNNYWQIKIENVFFKKSGPP